jgi:hypothetical protein
MDLPLWVAHGECRLGEVVRHRVGGIPAIADIADVIDPEVMARAVAVREAWVSALGVVRVGVIIRLVPIAGQRLEQPVVGMPAEDLRAHHLHRRAQEVGDVVPADHLQLIDGLGLSTGVDAVGVTCRTR